MQPESVAVLGGGLTGLSAAFHLSRRFPAACITILEKDARFGGWTCSERVKFNYPSPSGKQEAEEANVLFEVGPRTLRPNASAVLEIIHLLDLTSSIISVPKNSAAAQNRFLHVPGSQGIHRIPTSPLGIITSFQASAAHLGRILSSVILEPFWWGNRPSGIEDESVDAFLSRRFGAEFARVFGSALIHGIYAADSRKLSLRSVFPSMWDAEERGYGSVLLGFFRAPRQPKTDQDMPHDLGNLQDKMRGISLYTFKDGVGMLVDALVQYLQKRPNIQMYNEARVTGLSLDPSKNRFKITTASETMFATHVVSALPLYELEGILSSATPLPHLSANTYSSVAVVNLVFPQPSPASPKLHPAGFGYLSSRPAGGYSTDDGSGILGCVFDSCSTAAQDSTSDDQGIVKMTVMLGGPYVTDPLVPPQIDAPFIISELSRHLNRPLPSPLFVKVHSNIGCIPLYSVGHVQRMEELKRVLASGPWNGRMEVIGAGVAGVSVGDCVEAGRNAGKEWGQHG